MKVNGANTLNNIHAGSHRDSEPDSVGACCAATVPAKHSDRNFFGAGEKRENNGRLNRMKYILTLTRCCTYDCEFCAVDALYSPSVAGCADLADEQQAAGRELTPEQWCGVAKRILDRDPRAEFDLSGGDCLALPWVSRQLIPSILNQTQNPRQVAVTSTAKSLVQWIDKAGTSNWAKPGTIHITYDGYRPYSAENIALVPQVRNLGVDVHVECPLTTENCHVAGVRSVYHALKDARISELLLMRFFPVGRGADKSRLGGYEPSGSNYRDAIAEFMRLEKEHPDGPRVKVQCALGGFLPGGDGAAKCKMGDGTWCIMPNGTLLTCPWAYGMGGYPLDEAFNAGNALQTNVAEWLSAGRHLRAELRSHYPRKCIVRAFTQDLLDGTHATQRHTVQTGERGGN